MSTEAYGLPMPGGYGAVSEPVQRLHRLIDMSGDNQISDVHIHPGKPIRVLRRNVMQRAADQEGIFSESEIQEWLRYAKPNEKDPLAAKGHVSAAIASDKYRIRCTFRKSTAGTTVTFRVVPTVVPNADAIGVPKVIQDLTTRDSGLIVIEGPTGSGKTTLIASLINKINHEDNKHIYMVEDPIEFLHTENTHSSIVQREIGVHARDYTTAIEDAMRSKPNVIVIGELLDPATTRAALHAATTGHLVITTAHAGSVTEAIDSFIGKFTADEQPQIRSRFAQSMTAVVVQKLVKTTDKKLTAVREIMVNDQNFSELIREGKTHMLRAQMTGTKNNQTLEDSLAALVKVRAITRETALDACKNFKDMEAMLNQLEMEAVAA